VGFPGRVLFFGLCLGFQTGFLKSAVCPGFWPNPQVHSNVAGEAYRRVVYMAYHISCISKHIVRKGERRHGTKKAR